MAETCTISIEVKIGGVWTDITADVKAEPYPRGQRGIMGNRPDDRVAQPGYLTFYMKNDQSNSAKLLGYYSPGHTNCRSGWSVGLPVRLSVTYDTFKFYKWRGWIKKDGITVTPGELGPRDCRVDCEDWFAKAQKHEIAGMAYATNKRGDEAIALVHANMPLQPEATSLDVGLDTFPTFGDMTRQTTTAWNEYRKIAMSEFGYVYDRGGLLCGNTLVFEKRGARNSVGVLSFPYPASESGYLLSGDGSTRLAGDGSIRLVNDARSATFTGRDRSDAPPTITYGKNVITRVTETVYPRTLLTGATLGALDKSFSIAPGETKTGVTIRYRDPNNPSVRISVDTTSMSTTYHATANEDGTGADLTANLTGTPVYGTAEVTYELKNTHASTTLWVTQISPTGNGVTVYNPVSSVQNDSMWQWDATNEKGFGVEAVTLDLKYQVSVPVAVSFGAYVLSTHAAPAISVDELPLFANLDSLNMYGFLLGEPGTKITYAEPQSGASGDWFIQGYSFEIHPTGLVYWTPVLKSDPGYYSFGTWDSMTWDGTFRWS